MKESNIPKTIRDIISDERLIGKETPDDNTIADIENCAKLIKVPKNKAVVRQGEFFPYLVFIRIGLMRVSYSSDEEEDSLLFGTSGDVYASLHSLWKGVPAVFSLTAEVDSEVWIISKEDWIMLEERHPLLARWMRELLMGQLYSLERRYVLYTGKSAEERFQNFLSTNAFIKSIMLKIPLKHIAQYLGVTPSTLSRMRKKLVGR